MTSGPSPQMSEEPVDRLTRMCDAMTKTMEMHPESRPDDKCMVFLDDGKVGGMVLYGYEDKHEALVDLLLHIRAIFQANGKQVDFMFLDEEGMYRP